MASSHKLQALSEQFTKSTDKVEKSETVRKLLIDIEKRVAIFLKSPSRNELQEITKILDTIKKEFNGLSKADLLSLLNKIQTDDRERWKSFRWEDVNFNDKKYHEANNNDSFQRRGITGDNIMSIASQQRDPNEINIHLILNLAKVYGLTTAIISSRF